MFKISEKKLGLTLIATKEVKEWVKYCFDHSEQLNQEQKYILMDIQKKEKSLFKKYGSRLNERPIYRLWICSTYLQIDILTVTGAIDELSPEKQAAMKQSINKFLKITNLTERKYHAYMTRSSRVMRVFKLMFIFVSINSIIILLRTMRIDDPNTIQYVKYTIPIMWLNLLGIYTLIKLGGF